MSSEILTRREGSVLYGNRGLGEAVLLPRPANFPVEELVGSVGEALPRRGSTGWLSAYSEELLMEGRSLLEKLFPGGLKFGPTIKGADANVGRWGSFNCPVTNIGLGLASFLGITLGYHLLETSWHASQTAKVSV